MEGDSDAEGACRRDERERERERDREVIGGHDSARDTTCLREFRANLYSMPPRRCTSRKEEAKLARCI